MQRPRGRTMLGWEQGMLSNSKAKAEKEQGQRQGAPSEREERLGTAGAQQSQEARLSL